MHCIQSKPHEYTTGAATALWIWLTLGIAVMALFPGLRGSDPRLGWLPFWLIVAPLIDLAILRRCWLMAAACAFLVRTRRRYQPTRRQARHLPRWRYGRSTMNPVRPSWRMIHPVTAVTGRSFRSR